MLPLLPPFALALSRSLSTTLYFRLSFTLPNGALRIAFVVKGDGFPSVTVDNIWTDAVWAGSVCPERTLESGASANLTSVRSLHFAGASVFVYHLHLFLVVSMRVFLHLHSRVQTSAAITMPPLYLAASAVDSKGNMFVYGGYDLSQGMHDSRMSHLLRFVFFQLHTLLTLVVHWFSYFSLLFSGTISFSLF